MIQLIRFMRDAEDFNTGGSMQQTPIELAISELEEELKCIHDETSIGGISGLIKMKLQSILPYEKNRDRNIAEKAWDRCWDEGNSWNQDNEISKQTYLNQNHPL